MLSNPMAQLTLAQSPCSPPSSHSMFCQGDVHHHVVACGLATVMRSQHRGEAVAQRLWPATSDGSFRGDLPLLHEQAIYPGLRRAV